MNKMSIRFYNDHEVRAVWDEDNSKWWFSAIDIVRAINDEADYTKAGNYWRWLKRKLNSDGIQLVSITHDFKFESPDGKKRAADALDSNAVQILAKHYPAGRAADFIDWFTYSENTIDGRSKKKAYAFWESDLINDENIGTTKSLQQIHAYIFGGLYDFAGKIKCYVGEGRLTNDPIDTKGGPAVIQVPELQKLMHYICNNGFEHHVAMNRALVSDALEEALGKYLGWDVYAHR